MKFKQYKTEIIQSYLINHLPNGIISITHNGRDNRKINIGLFSCLILGLLSFLADYLDYLIDGLYVGIFFFIIVSIILIAKFLKFHLVIDKVNKHIILNKKTHANINHILIKNGQLDRDSLGALKPWNIPVISAVTDDGIETELLMMDSFLSSDENAVRKTKEAVAQFKELFNDNWPVEIEF